MCCRNVGDAYDIIILWFHKTYKYNFICISIEAYHLILIASVTKKFIAAFVI